MSEFCTYSEDTLLTHEIKLKLVIFKALEQPIYSGLNFQLYCRMVGFDLAYYIRPLYNKNNNFNKLSGEDSNALDFSALASP